MSPEQAAGRLDALGPASDVYSLGATLYVLLTDRGRFEGDVTEVLQMVQEGRFEPPRQVKPRVPEALDAICRRAMALEPAASVPVGHGTGRGHRALAGGRARLGLARSLAGPGAAMGAAPPAVGGRLGGRGRRRRRGLGLAVPLLSLAWRNESAARRDERRQRILALSKAREAEANEGKPGKKKTCARRHSGSWSTRFAGPIRSWMAARSRSSISSIRPSKTSISRSATSHS